MESSEQTNRKSAITSTTNYNGTANIPQLANDLRSTNGDIHYSALQRLVIAIMMEPTNIEAVKQQEIIGILNNFLVSEVQQELQELSVSILGVLGAHGKHRRKRSHALASEWALIQIILSSDEVLSRQGTEALCKLIVADEQIRDAMLSRRFVDLVLETLSNHEQIKKQSSSSSSDQEDESEPIFVKVGLLSVVLKLAEEIENPIILGVLIPILEEIKKNGEKEMSKKAKTILGCLQQEGITVPSQSSDSIKDEKIRQLEETNRRLEEIIRKLDEEKEREKIEKDEQNKIKITELSDSKSKPIINNQIVSQPKSDEIPISITVPSGSFKRLKDEFTFISINRENKTFPINPTITNGIYKCDIKFNKHGQTGVGVMKSGLFIPFGKTTNKPPFCNDCVSLFESGNVWHNCNKNGGNQGFDDGDIISIQVNMDSKPRTGHCFNNN
ncbi:MAG: hypothetical protein EZS28_039728, partial [Streblomastix strix]